MERRLRGAWGILQHRDLRGQEHVVIVSFVGEEPGSAAAVAAVRAPMAIPGGLDLVGLGFLLVGKLRVPTTRVIPFAGNLHMLGDDRPWGCTVVANNSPKAEAQDLAVAAPEILDPFDDFQ